MTGVMDNFEGMIELKDDEFRSISDLIYSRFGIHLTEKKKALVRGRLNKLIKMEGFSSFTAYFDSVVADTSGKKIMNMVDKISTNHSFFYRETDHFDLLKNHILAEISLRLTNTPKDLRIWCAGCAGGEEAYTLVMVLIEYFGYDIITSGLRILATDISLTALEIAQTGIYPGEKLINIPKRMFKQYFTDIGDGQYAIHDSIKKMVLFKHLNLMNESYPFKGKFDIIFCRNVMIYFDQETKKNLVKRYYRYMKQKGYLFIGHSESLGRDSNEFQYLQPAVYKARELSEGQP